MSQFVLRRASLVLLLITGSLFARVIADDSPVALPAVLANQSAYDGKVFWLTATAVHAIATATTGDTAAHLTIVLKAGDTLMLAIGDAKRDVGALNAAASIEARARGTTPPTVLLFGKYSKPGSPDQLDKHAHGFFAISNVVSLDGNVFCLSREATRCPAPPGVHP